MERKKLEVGTLSQRKSTNHQHALFIHQEDPEDLLDTTIPSVEDIKIEQERTNCKGFEVRIYILIAPVEDPSLHCKRRKPNIAGGSSK